jgi:hypothetical protein
MKQHELGDELVCARTSKRGWYLGADEIGDRPPAQATAYVQQYKFIRLERRANYEPLIMCLKGLQLDYNPGDYLSADQLKTSGRLRREYEDLINWAVEPTEISRQTVSEFIKIVHQGLLQEAHRRSAHQLHYIDWALGAVTVQLRLNNS